MNTNEFCPHCRMLVRSHASEATERRVDPAGRMRDVIVRSFHCEKCRAFLRSEDLPCPVEEPPHGKEHSA